MDVATLGRQREPIGDYSVDHNTGYSSIGYYIYRLYSGNYFWSYCNRGIVCVFDFAQQHVTDEVFDMTVDISQDPRHFRAS